MIKRKKLFLFISLMAVVFVFSGCKKENQDYQAKLPDNKNTSENQDGGNDGDAGVLFATNGTNSIYKKQRDLWMSIVVNGKEGKAYDNVYSPAYSPDGTQFAYAAELNNQTFVVVNNMEEINAYDGVSSIVFNPGNNQVAFVAEKGENEVVIINGEESDEYEGVGTLSTWSGGSEQIIFSSNGEQAAYKVEEGDQEYVVINGEEGEKYDEIGNFDFSDEGDQFAYEAESEGNEVVVVDDQEVTQDDAGSSPGGNSQSPGGSASGINQYNKDNFDREYPQISVCEQGDSGCNF